MGLFDFLKPKKPVTSQATVPVTSTNSISPQSKDITVKVTGTKYTNINEIESLGKKNPDYSLTRAQLIKKFPEGERIDEFIYPKYPARFEFEPTNEYDPNAIKVFIKNVHVGYVKRGSCSRIRNLITNDKIISITAKISSKNTKYLYCYDDDDEIREYELETAKGDSPFIKLTVSVKE